MDLHLKGRRALVTGSTAGIGLAIAGDSSAGNRLGKAAREGNLGRLGYAVMNHFDGDLQRTLTRKDDARPQLARFMAGRQRRERRRGRTDHRWRISSSFGERYSGHMSCPVDAAGFHPQDED